MQHSSALESASRDASNSHPGSMQVLRVPPPRRRTGSSDRGGNEIESISCQPFTGKVLSCKELRSISGAAPSPIVARALCGRDSEMAGWPTLAFLCKAGTSECGPHEVCVLGFSTLFVLAFNPPPFANYAKAGPPAMCLGHRRGYCRLCHTCSCRVCSFEPSKAPGGVNLF